MKVLFIFGTRPEAIKLAPVIKAFKNHDEKSTFVCTTGQHKEMLDQVLAFFKIIPDYELNVMKPNQDLFDITASILEKLKKVLDEVEPDLVFVQGDTTTAFVGALAAFYRKIKVAHIEAGLRSQNLYSPFPEEANRQLVGRITNYHFAPTQGAKKALVKENIPDKNIFVVGNTVVDALLTGLDIVKKENDEELNRQFSFIDFNKKLILVTGHRRESFGEPFKNICNALKSIATTYPEVEIVYPVHLNPNVRNVVFDTLKNVKNIHLIEPLAYAEMIWLMEKSYFLLTDSGGLQEEAPSLGKPVLVMRDVTERVEGIEAGTAILVGTDENKIISEAKNLLDNLTNYKNMARAENPYGDGETSERILKIIEELNEK